MVVQISYRVGALGFLAGSKVKEGGDFNVGLLDQRKVSQKDPAARYRWNADHALCAGTAMGQKVHSQSE